MKNIMARKSRTNVYVAAVGSQAPTSIYDPFSADWSIVDVLGSEPTCTSDFDTTSYGWGEDDEFILKTVRKNLSVQMKFTVARKYMATPRIPVNVMLALETYKGNKTRRIITRNYAQIDSDEGRSKVFPDPSKTSLIATIYPDVAGIYFDEQSASRHWYTSRVRFPKRKAQVTK